MTVTRLDVRLVRQERAKRIKKCVERNGNWVQERCRALPDSSRPDPSRVVVPEGKEVELDVPEVVGSKEVSVPVAVAPPPKKISSAPAMA